MQYRCPHCGAPPPNPVPQFGQFAYTCPYCKAQSMLGTPAPQPYAPPPPPQPSVTPFHAPPPQIHVHPPVGGAARNMGWIIWVVVVVFMTSGAGVFRMLTRSSSVLSALVWSGDEPLQCGGNDEITVSGVEASFAAGSAIVAGGNCHVKCTDCNLGAPTAINASGNAQVTIVNGTVRGGTYWGVASGNARIMALGNVTVTGRTQQSGSASVTK